jgi:hypothetical protein
MNDQAAVFQVLCSMMSAFEPLNEILQRRRQLAAFMIAAPTQFARNVLGNIARPATRRQRLGDAPGNTLECWT